jgi:hypothetical protein
LTQPVSILTKYARLKHAGPAGVCAICLLMLAPARGFAQDLSSLPDVPVSFADCAQDWSDRLRDQLRIEIDALAKERQDATHPELDQVGVECRGSEVRIRVRVRSGAEKVAALDPIGLEPDARVRTVALTVTELIGALWFDAEAPSPRRPAPPRARPAPPTPATASQRAPAMWIGGSLKRVGSPGTWLGGGVVALELPVTRALAPLFDLRGEFGRAPSRVAPVTVETWSFGAELLIGSHEGKFRWGAGPGFRLGWATLRGEPATTSNLVGHRVAGWFGGPAVAARLGYSILYPFLWVGLAVDGGLVTLPVTGRLDAGPALFAMDGAWVGAALSLGLSW